MFKNIGSIDRIIRIVVGIVIMAFGYLNHSWLGLIGLVPFLTAIVGYCPAYSLLGINTCANKSR